MISMAKTQISVQEINSIIYWLIRNAELEIAFSNSNGASPRIDTNDHPTNADDRYGRFPLTEDSWENFSWIPLDTRWFYNNEHDGDQTGISPKPTWKQMCDYLNEVQVENHIRSTDYYSHLAGGFHADVLSAESHDHPSHEKNIDVGAGIKSLPGIAYLVDQSNQAGQILPRMTLKSNDGESVLHLWSESQVRNLLNGVAYRRNRAESARNIVDLKIKKMRKDALDRAIPLAQRVVLANKIVQIDLYAATLARSSAPHEDTVKVMEELFKDALKEVDDSFNALPDDLELAKDRLAAWIEAVSNAHIEHLKNSATQQGMDLPESCVDQRTAVRKVGTLAQHYKLEVEAADSVARGKAIYLTAKESIENVTVLNTPIYALINFNEIEADTVRLVADSAGKAKIIAKHPRTTPPIEGIISVRPIPVDVPSNGGVSTSIKRTEGEFTHTEIEFTNTSSDDHFWQIIARNICGPSRILTVEVQSAPND